MKKSAQSFLPIGAIVNATTVIVGSLIGYFFHESFNDAYQTIIFQALGLGVLLIGVKMCLKMPEDTLVPLILGLVGGALLGEYLQVDLLFDEMAQQIQSIVGSDDSEFSEGLVTAFVIFCIGAMTILGSMEEGLSGNRTLIYFKSALDGFTAIALSAAYGIGVLFSFVPLLIIQATITISSKKLKPYINDHRLNVISGVGGLLILAISFNLMGMAKINVPNLLPSLVLVPLVVWIKTRFISSS